MKNDNREELNEEAQGQLRGHRTMIKQCLTSTCYLPGMCRLLSLLVSGLLSQVYGGCLCLPQDTTIGSGVITAQLSSTEDTDKFLGKECSEHPDILRHPSTSTRSSTSL